MSAARLCLLLAACLILGLGQRIHGGPAPAKGEKVSPDYKPARTDRYGDPLPPGAIARLGTGRLRHSSEVGGNWFAPIRIEVPTAAGHPGPQFGVVAERLARARSEPALSLTSALAATISRLPIRLLIPALHAQADTVDFAATTLPGSRSQRHLCGTAIEQSYPFGPRLGCPLNISAFGNEDRLDIGIAVDSATVPDPELLVECLNTAFASFVPAVQSGREPAAAGTAGPTASTTGT